MADLSAQVYSTSGSTTMAITWYKRLTATLIEGAVEDLIRAEVRKLIQEDSVLRAKVREAIELAALSMPLEAITKAVKEAIAEVKQP